MTRARMFIILVLALGLGVLSIGPAAAAQPAKPAVVDGSTWYLRSTLTGGAATTSFTYGRRGDMPLMCDWNGNGTATAAVVREVNDELIWHIRQHNSGGRADITLSYGLMNDLPVCGDWNGDGRDTPGLVRTNDRTGRLTWFLRRNLRAASSSSSFVYGRFANGVPTTPIVGDWNGNGVDTIGVVYARAHFEWHLRNTNTGGVADRVFRYFRTVLRLNGGEHEGLPFDPALWQKFVTGSCYGWERSDGGRRFRQAFVETAKGSGKALAIDTPIPTWQVTTQLLMSSSCGTQLAVCQFARGSRAACTRNDFRREIRNIGAVPGRAIPPR